MKHDFIAPDMTNNEMFALIANDADSHTLTRNVRNRSSNAAFIFPGSQVKANLARHQEAVTWIS